MKLVDNFDAEYEYITNTGTVFTFKTNLKSPKYKLINIDFDKPEMENWTDLVAESETDVLEWSACVAGDKLVLCYLHDVKVQFWIYCIAECENKTVKIKTASNFDAFSWSFCLKMIPKCVLCALPKSIPFLKTIKLFCLTYLYIDIHCASYVITGLFNMIMGPNYTQSLWRTCEFPTMLKWPITIGYPSST